ncbi:MAG: flagellin [Thioclava marina]|uniref:flagellin N-terminal helical domain-containing protein n=1 Tax=Thioclava marina TaxID=1915077 RepID=UPI00198E628A|nr:flagellin [Thioclava marina]MBC7147344.1 flagellin [Thioclava marina]TNF11709.1 MAG: flagellin [Paracoccaceae bacterium]
MSSILTNTSAMVALQTLKGINSNLATTQSEISTGKSVGSAKDNAAVWAISKVMESDVKGFKGISDSLALGESTVAVARQASETITDLLTEMKGKVVAAQESNVDRVKIQDDIVALRDQIKSVVGAAQFNGLNLIEGMDSVSVLSSLDRQSDGSVNASQIVVSRQDLTMTDGSLGTGAGLTDLSTNVQSTSTTLSATAIRDDGAGTPADISLTGDFSGDSLSFNIGGTTVSFAVGDLSATNTTAAQTIADAINAAQIEGITVANNAGTLEFSSTRDFDQTTISVTQGGASSGTLGAGSVTLDQRAETFTFSNVTVNEGDGYQFALSNGVTATYVASNGDTMEDVVKGLKVAIDSENNADLTTKVSKNGSDQWIIEIANDNATDATVTITANDDVNGNAVQTGGLSGLDNIDVTNDAGASAALDNIETMIQTSIEAAAQFGSVASRIETQASFISNLTDSMKAGIGSLVDADMEEASARLQALQTQQQLGIQALSIANQQPQNILSLFR